MEGFGVTSSVLDCDCVGATDAVVETEDDEFILTGPPVRRFGGGGGALEAVVGGDCAAPERSGSDTVVDRSALAMGLGFSWLCLRESGGVGGLRFCDIWLFCTSAGSKYISRLGGDVAA